MKCTTRIRANARKLLPTCRMVLTWFKVLSSGDKKLLGSILFSLSSSSVYDLFGTCAFASIHSMQAWMAFESVSPGTWMFWYSGNQRVFLLCGKGGDLTQNKLTGCQRHLAHWRLTTFIISIGIREWYWDTTHGACAECWPHAFPLKQYLDDLYVKNGIVARLTLVLRLSS